MFCRKKLPKLRECINQKDGEKLLCCGMIPKISTQKISKPQNPAKPRKAYEMVAVAYVILWS